MPRDPETEAILLKACMLEGFEDQKAEVVTKVKPQEFYNAANREYFQSVLNLDAEGRFPTAKRIYADIKKRKKQKVATLAGISKIYDAELISVDIKNNISDLKDLADRRGLIEVANAVIKKSGNGSHCTAAEVLEYVLQKTASIKGDTAECEAFYENIEGCSAEEVLNMDFPEPKWVIRDIIPEGVLIFAGKPKAGKSVMATNICVAVAIGGKYLDRDVEQGPVLYLHLEDNQRRLKTRIEAMVPIDDYTGRRPSGLEHLDLYYQWPRMGEGGLRALDAYFRDHKPRLVVIDTFKAFQPKLIKSDNKKTQYDLDYDWIIALRPLAERHNTTIMIIVHARKQSSDDPIDLISGTLGRAGAVDNCLILTEREGNRAKIYTVGRDVDNEMYIIEYIKSAWMWIMLGNPEHVMATDSQQEVLSFLLQNSSEEEPVTLTEIRTNTKVKPSNLQNRILPKLVKKGLVKRVEKGLYYAA
jgi:hypothetical protein